MTSSLQPRSAKGRRRWDEGIPPLLRPLVRAYILGYASAVAPRLLTLILRIATNGRRRDPNGITQPSQESFLVSLRQILRGGLELQRFPTFCAALIGGTSLLQVPLRRVCSRLVPQLSGDALKRLSRWLASFIAAWLSLKLLQSKQSDEFTDTVAVESKGASGAKIQTIRYAGRTLDLTLFAFSRALDVIIGELWAQRRARRVAAGRWTKLDSAISKLTDPSMFATSCAFIMWSWFYFPSRLPRAYNKWIGSAAAVDARLIEALQLCQKRELRYGEDTGVAPLLQGMCSDYKWPLEWGDPVTAIPFPCTVVHMGTGPSCEYHALSRFLRSFKWSMATYLPLNLLLIARRPNLKGLQTALISAVRSSAFLGGFIAFFYYGVCLARTRLGPHLIGEDRASCQKIDGGICVGSGCFLCGWSILLEAPGRRKDMALFVAPRAMATVLPRRYALDKQWRETFVFAFSTAVVFTCIMENQKRVRGVLGKVLGSVLNA